MTWGPQVKFLEGLKEQGMDPPALRNRPVVEGHLRYYQEVFSELTDSRGYSQSGVPLHIPISEYGAYCEFFGIRSITERERLFRMIRAMDRAFVKVVSAQVKARLDSKTNSVVEHEAPAK